MRWCLLTILLIVACAWLRALADEPFQVVQRAGEPAARHLLEVGLGYTPSGTQGIGVSDTGIPYSFTCETEDWQAGLSLSLQLTDASKIEFDLTECLSRAREQRMYANGEAETLATRESDLSYALSREWRIAEATAWDPRITISFGYPWTGELAGSVSLLRDPVVLAGKLRVLTQQPEPHDWLDLSLGAGFVASPAISLSTLAHFMVPRSGIGLPVTVFGMRVAYSLDASGNRQIAIGITLRLEGETPALSVQAEVSWSGS
jgi:hypothetical protein